MTELQCSLNFQAWKLHNTQGKALFTKECMNGVKILVSHVNQLQQKIEKDFNN